MRLIEVDEAKEQVRQMQVLKPSEKTLLMLALDRTQTYEPPNAPLTLKELREMDGEPVWCARWGVWGLVDIGFAAVVTRTGDLDINDEGMHERLYRRKPEEGTE